jgi:hypothetical protein
MKSLLVSVNYSDYLDYILPYNSLIFDEIIVVTIKSDIDCQKVCNKHKTVKCIVVEDSLIKYNNAAFNKGRLVNEGMSYLEGENYQGFLCLTDSDVIFNNFNARFNHHIDKLNSIGIDTRQVLMGMARYIIEKQENFLSWQKNPHQEHDFLKRLPLGKERTLLGYAQIFYFDHLDEYRDHNNEAIWAQDLNCVNAQIVDSKFIGKFQNRAKQSLNWRDRVTQDTDEYIYEFIKYGDKQGLEYGVHIEDKEMFCLHIGETWLNRDGRVTDKWT